MHDSQADHRFYRALLRLYPKSHREKYGEQMVRTLDDFLNDDESSSSKFAIWVRVFSELPFNIFEEHINNREGRSMKKQLSTRTKQLAAVGAVILLVMAGLVVVLSDQQFKPSTSADLQKANAKPLCLTKQDSSDIKITEQESNSLVNAVMMGVNDVPAGTSINAYIKTYDGTTATGTSVYPENYGSYNFVLKKSSSSTSDTYTNGWAITELKACQ